MERTLVQFGIFAGLDPGSGARPGWLSGLYKAQAIADSGVRMAVLHETLLRGGGPACSLGCTGCCKTREPLATSVELAGALWFVRQGNFDSLERIMNSMDVGVTGCPFLLDEVCSVHPMRPLACRQLMVFARPCVPGEDPARSRPGDMLTPLGGHAVRVASILESICRRGGLAPERKPLRQLHREASAISGLAAA